jgi:hypothetical protein
MESGLQGISLASPGIFIDRANTPDLSIGETEVSKANPVRILADH